MNGLVLQGGGTRGSYHIGVWKALREMGIEINAVTGTSIGALNGAMIVQNKFNEVYDLWYNIKPTMLCDIDSDTYEKLLELDLKKESIASYIKYIKNTLLRGGLDISAFEKLADKVIDEEMIRTSKIKFGLVTVSLTDLKPLELLVEEIPKGLLKEYLLASAHLPFFKLNKVDGKRLMDGGFYDNQPVNLMLKIKGIDKIIIVDNQGLGFKRKANVEGIEIIKIEASGNLGNTLEFTEERSRANLKMGYYDTLRAFGKCKGIKYCIKDFDEYKYLKSIYNIDYEKINKIAKVMNVKNANSKRKLFEKILPEMANMLKVSKNSEYKELFIKIIEDAAEHLEIDRFKIYTFKQILTEIKMELLRNDKKIYSDNKKMLMDFLKQSNIVIGSVKNEIIIEIMSILLIE